MVPTRSHLLHRLCNVYETVADLQSRKELLNPQYYAAQMSERTFPMAHEIFAGVSRGDLVNEARRLAIEYVGRDSRLSEEDVRSIHIPSAKWDTAQFGIFASRPWLILREVQKYRELVTAARYATDPVERSQACAIALDSLVGWCHGNFLMVRQLALNNPYLGDVGLDALVYNCVFHLLREKTPDDGRRFLSMIDRDRDVIVGLGRGAAWKYIEQLYIDV